MSARGERSVVGNTALERFDVLVIGSGAAGSAVTEVLARNGQKVLVLEAGSNYFEGLDDPDPAALRSLYSNDEIKLMRRNFIAPDPLVEPRTFRSRDSDGDRTFVGDVNQLPKTVGGGGIHANLASLRFAPFDFELGSRLGDVPGASFADWPVSYDEIEPFYAYGERMLGVQGDPDANPFEPPRSAPYPMEPGIEPAIGDMVGAGAEERGYHPYRVPQAITSRPYDGRPACVGCGFCAFYGCPTNAKGSPAVTSLRRALLTGNVQLRAETRVVKLQRSGGKREISGVLALDPDGRRVSFSADRYVLAASPIEDARLLALSGGGRFIGNASGQVGRNLTFHLATGVAGVFEQRLHPNRGKAATTGFADFRGEPGAPDRPLGGLVVTGSPIGPVVEGLGYTAMLPWGRFLGSFTRQSWLRDRSLSVLMFGEDAPQPSNRVDLDPLVRDLDDLPVARITYRSHDFELSARRHYLPKLVEVVKAAGSVVEFTQAGGGLPGTRHIMGTLRFGDDRSRSVCDRRGRFHDIGNLYGSGAALFPTSSGYNPILTITALSSWVGANLVNPGSPEAALAGA